MHEVLVMNLPREVTRKNMCMGGLLAVGVPLDKINVWKGNDDREFDYTEDVFKCAFEIDGFKAFGDALKSGYYEEVHIGYACQLWNYMRMWRYAIDSGEPCLIIQDDFAIHHELGYYGLLDALKIVGDDDPNFKIVLVGTSPDWNSSIYRDPDFLESEMNISKGLIGMNDTCFVVTPLGGEWLIENFSWDNDEKNYQNFLYNLSLKDSPYVHPTGSYTIVGGRCCMKFPERLTPSTLHDSKKIIENDEYIILRGAWDTLREETDENNSSKSTPET